MDNLLIIYFLQLIIGTIIMSIWSGDKDYKNWLLINTFVIPNIIMIIIVCVRVYNKIKNKYGKNNSYS